MAFPRVNEPTNTSREIPIQEGLPPTAVKGLAEFVKTHYADVQLSSLAGQAYRERWSADRKTVELDWEFSGTGRPWSSPLANVTTMLSIGPRSITISFSGVDLASVAQEQARRKVADDLELLVTSFLQRAKMTSLYFIFSAERNVSSSPTPPGSMAGGALRRLLSGNMTNLYLMIMAVSFLFFFLIGNYAIFAVLVLQLVTLFYSDRFALMSGKVRPTAERPTVTIVSIPASPETRRVIAKYAKNLVSEISDRLAKGVSSEQLASADAVKAVQGVLESSSVRTPAEDITIVTRDVYGLVKGVADRFKLPVPKIAIVNNVADNAAATGVSPGHASVVITAGSLEDLGDSELSAVLGHELGHIRGRDSLILFTVTFALYFGGLFFWLPLITDIALYYVAIILVFAIIFAVGKVLETRADTESVAKLGDPDVLASALTKIGFRQLYYERYSPGIRVFDWLRFDPHPPIYFRIQRLSKFAVAGTRIGNTFLLSLRDCLVGFFRSFL